jgi:hypothetical protein
MLRIHHEISLDEWRCAATKLAEIDKRLTGECAERAVAYLEFQAAQRAQYAECWGSGRDELVEDAVAITR